MITLFLMTFKGFYVLNSIVEKGFSHQLYEVIIGKDSNIDNDYSKEIENLCFRNKIKCRFRTSIDAEFESKFAIALSWRWLITFSEGDGQELIVLHDSLLPKYRGFAPLVNQLINGENEIGVTALFAVKEYDKGDIISQSKEKISYPIKIGDAINILVPHYSKLVLDIIEKIESKTPLSSTPQDEQKASYSLWRDYLDYKIDWRLSSRVLKRTVDALSAPYSGAYCYLNNNKIIIFDVEIVEDLKIENRDVGKVIFVRNGMPTVVCGEGLLRVINAKYVESGDSILPMKKFRSRFE